MVKEGGHGNNHRSAEGCRREEVMEVVEVFLVLVGGGPVSCGTPVNWCTTWPRRLHGRSRDSAGVRHSHAEGTIATEWPQSTAASRPGSDSASLGLSPQRDPSTRSMPRATRPPSQQPSMFFTAPPLGSGLIPPHNPALSVCYDNRRAPAVSGPPCGCCLPLPVAQQPTHSSGSASGSSSERMRRPSARKHSKARASAYCGRRANGNKAG